MRTERLGGNLFHTTSLTAILGLILVFSGTARCEDLLILLPYKSGSGNAVLSDSNWVRLGETLESYKETTGLDTVVRTLDEVNASYTGVDEAERVKKAIHHYARNRGVDYVFLVGDTGVFPVRYCFSGYTTAGDPIYAWDADGSSWYLYDGYGFAPSDAYFSNLWDNDDPAKTFDSWDGDGDGLFREVYWNDTLGPDGVTFHPDISLGRLPCNTTEEFQNYIVKLVAYERTMALEDSDYINNVLLLSGVFDDSVTRLRELRADFGSAYDSTLIYGTGVEHEPLTYFEEEDDISTPLAVAPDARILEHMVSLHPCFMAYAGHGWEGGWAEMELNRNQVAGASESWITPAVFASACSTGKFAAHSRTNSIPAIPVTSTANLECMADGFLTQPDPRAGGICYIGSVTSSQPPMHGMLKSFYQAIAGGAPTLGLAWRQTVEAFIVAHDLDGGVTPEWEEHDSYPHLSGGKWNWFPLAKMGHVYKVTFFGDPSARPGGVDIMDDTAPITTVFMDRWINREDKNSADPFYLHPFSLAARDPETGVLTTSHRYFAGLWSDSHTSLSGTMSFHRDFLVEGEDIRFQCWSENFAGRSEDRQTIPVQVDLTLPRSTLVVNGVESPVAVDGVVSAESGNVQITAEDDESGIKWIQYTYGDRGRWNSHLGHTLTLDFPPCMPTGTPLDLRYRAVDAAGNVETEHRVNLDLGTMSTAAWIACFHERIEEIFHFPPAYTDQLVGLTFLETVAGYHPDSLRFDVSGPVQGADYQENWQFLGDAVYISKARAWVHHWDTTAAKVDNAFYWVQAVPQGIPFMSSGGAAAPLPPTYRSFILINNLEKGVDYQFNLHASPKTAIPGDVIAFNLSFSWFGPYDLSNVHIGLVGDPAFWKVQDLSDLTRDVPVLKAGALWNTEFQILVAQTDGDRVQFPVSFFLHSDEIAFLQSGLVEITVEIPPTDVEGYVRDPLGMPVMAKLRLKEPAQNLEFTKATDAGGRYRFDDVPPGNYQLETQLLTPGYRQVAPPTNPVSLVVAGRDITQHFTAALHDEEGPHVEQWLRWQMMESSGIVYGPVYEEYLGSGVDAVEIAYFDEQNGRWWNGHVWGTTPTWLAVDILESLEDFVDDLDTNLAELTAVRRTRERARLGSLAGTTWPGRHALVWKHGASPPSTWPGNRTVLKIRARDEAGNTRMIRLANPVLRGQFVAELTNPVRGSGPASARAAAAPWEVRFTDLSGGRSLGSYWEFGDGETSGKRHPVHQYAHPGIYTVSLTFGNEDSSETVTQHILVDSFNLEFTQVGQTTLMNALYQAVTYLRRAPPTTYSLEVQHSTEPMGGTWSNTGVIQEWQVIPLADGLEEVTALVPVGSEYRLTRIEASTTSP